MKTILEQRSDILKKLEYAKSFTPHKVEYYQEVLKEFDNQNIDYYVYESPKVRIYWNNKLQFGCFYSVSEAIIHIAGSLKGYSFHTPDAIINL